MDNPQRAKLDAGNRVSAYNKKYAALLSTIPEYGLESKNFDNALVIINNAAQVQASAAGTQTDAVTLAKQNMANITIKYALRAVVKAKQIGNLVLANSLSHPVSYLSKTTKTQAVHRAKDIRDTLNDNLAILPNITADNINEIDGVIAVYNDIKDNPTIDKQTKAATGTNPLPAAFVLMTESIDNMYDLVVSYFGETNRPMVDEFGLAKQIISTGVHHNGLDGAVTKAGIAVAGASITVVGNNKSAISDKDGHYSLSKLKTGNLSITASHPDGSQQTKTVTISKANVETVDFEF